VRFVLVAIFASLFLLFLSCAMVCLEFGVFELPDTDLPPYPTPTVLQRVDDAILFIGILPLSILGIVCNKFDINPPNAFWCVMLITPGLFWASVIELFIRVWRRRVA
jgi:hypothetical protein